MERAAGEVSSSQVIAASICFQGGSSAKTRTIFGVRDSRILGMPGQATASAARPAVTRIAAVAGLLIVAAFTFGRAPGAEFVVRALADRLPASVVPDVLSDILKCGMAALLAAIAFVVARRPPSFYGMRRIGKEDALAVLKTLSALFAAVIVFRLIQDPFFSAPLPSGEGDAEQMPLLYGLVDAIVAGLTEEFVFRGFLIEELGELSRNRSLAAFVSVVAFGVAHVGSGYGWSVDLVYPTLCGGALSALYLWRRNLWACVVMHIGLDVLYAALRAI